MHTANSKHLVSSLTYGPGTEIGQSLERAWENVAEELPNPNTYDSDLEQLKETSFVIDAINHLNRERYCRQRGNDSLAH